MSADKQEPMEMATKPIKEHEWLQKLVGEWRVESEMDLPDGSKMKSQGTASVKSLGGLWAYSENHDTMPDGTGGVCRTLLWAMTFHSKSIAAV